MSNETESCDAEVNKLREEVARLKDLNKEAQALADACRQIGFPMVSENCRKVVDSVQKRLAEYDSKAAKETSK